MIILSFVHLSSDCLEFTLILSLQRCELNNTLPELRKLVLHQASILQHRAPVYFSLKICEVCTGKWYPVTG